MVYTGGVPKVVDHDARRQAIADALLAVARREGVGAVSVRSVAAEAGLSVGAMRHTAASQGELVAFAMRTVAERAAQRVGDRSARSAGRAEPDVDELVDLCCELVPLDEERRVEAAVWLELVTLARTDGTLRAVSEQAHAGIGRVVGAVVAAVLGRDGGDGLLDLETARLHALLDGLVLHEVLYPGLRDAALMRAVVRDHLQGLADGRPGGRPALS